MLIRTFGWTLIAACVATVGCGPRDEITSYSVPKESIAAPVSAADSAAPSDRMLAAVLPDGDRAWFFKVTGPMADVDANARQILEFFQSVRLAPGQAQPEWQLPAGWQARGASAMRVATLVIPAGAKSLELSVTQLPWAGPDAMLSNINRWRGQMLLPPIDQAGLAEQTREVVVGNATMTVVDLRGNMTAGMTPPFAGGGMPPATGPAGMDSSALPPGHPVVGSQPSPAAAPFEFTAPAGWQSRPASGLRKAEFLVTEGDQSATMTAIDFPASAGPMMADPVANLNRWRGEVGLAPLAPDAAKAAMEAIQVGGAEGNFMAALPDASQPGQSQADRGTLAAMVRVGDTIWFFKLSGDRDVVAAQRGKFLEFLKSVRFNGGGGANDGN